MDDSPILTVMVKDRIIEVTLENVINAFWDAFVAIGEHRLGTNKKEDINDIGTHSIRLGAAMAMYLGECTAYTIMLIGR